MKFPFQFLPAACCLLTLMAAAPRGVEAQCPLLQCDDSGFSHSFSWSGVEEALHCHSGPDPNDQTCHSAPKGGICADKHIICEPTNDAVELADAFELQLATQPANAVATLLAEGGAAVRYDERSDLLTITGCGDNIVASFTISSEDYVTAIALLDSQ